jgi:hypothetical protein
VVVKKARSPLPKSQTSSSKLSERPFPAEAGSGRCSVYIEDFEAPIVIASRYQRNGACFLPSKSQAYSFPAGFLK